MELYSVDKLCHGLITQAIYQGAMEDTQEAFVCLRPEQAPVDFVLLIPNVASFLKSHPQSNFPLLKESYWIGEFSKAELAKVEKILPKLKAWEAEKR